MNATVVWIAGLVVILVVGGLIAFQALAPQEALISPLPSEEPFGNFVIEESATVSPVDVSTEQEYTSPLATPTASTTVSPTATAAATITISDTGFSPPTLTVASGTTVTFVNNGQALHWPASDPHPVHTGLPGFDAKAGLATGSTYSFTFTKAGTWAFHDHLNPSLKGTVTVK